MKYDFQINAPKEMREVFAQTDSPFSSILEEQIPEVEEGTLMSPL